MVFHLQVDYLTLEDGEIEDIVEKADREDSLVVLQSPRSDDYTLIAEEVRSSFDTLTSSLEGKGIDYRVVSTPQDVVDYPDEDEWGTVQTITAVLSAVFIFLTLPAVFSLRKLYDWTDDGRYLRIQKRILETATINEVWSSGVKSDLAAQSERMTDEVRSIIDTTDSDPLVVTYYGVELEL